MDKISCFAAVFTALSLLTGCASDRTSESLEKRVTWLVNETTRSARSQGKALEELEELGQQAVPYLVSHLGDMRPLAKPTIELRNKSAEAFEGFRSYNPKTVHDALAAVLNQITGESFGFVYNGATPSERKDNQRRWANWCRSAFPSEFEVCGQDDPDARGRPYD